MKPTSMLDTAEKCRGTPAVKVVDNRGLAVRALQVNRSAPGGAADEQITRQRYSPIGHLLSSLDPRLFETQQLDPAVAPNFRYRHSLSGQVLRQQGVDAGQHVQLSDIAGGLLWQQGARGQFKRCSYDALHRLSTLHEQDSPSAPERIADAAQPVRYHHNQRVVPANDYQYDALYQLTCATGRENAGAAAQGPGLPVPQVPLSVDPNAFSTYTRRYNYDRGANLLRIRHQGAQDYTLDMLVAPTSNRAVQQTGHLTPGDVDGHFDAAGNLLQLAPGQALRWDGRNQLQGVAQVLRHNALDDAETYQYDGGGQRLRKTTLSHTRGTVRSAQVLYLPGLELRVTQREQGGTSSTVEELHVISAGGAGRQQVRVLHWEAGQPADIPNDQLRGSLDNQIGSSLLELDQQAEILTLEEYFPFGGTAVWSGKTVSETKYKFVRYSGQERDATGLYYYGFRYYAPWLGRWLNPDPAGTVDGLNLFRMVRNKPVTLLDNDGLMPRKTQVQSAEETREAPLPEEIEAGHAEFVSPVSLRGAVAPQEGHSVMGDADASYLSGNRINDFFRVDISPPSEILRYGFVGNSTSRTVKLYGDDTIFASQSLEGIDEFRSEISSPKNLFGDARKYYFDLVLVDGYMREKPKSLNLYKISLTSDHPHEVLSDFFMKEESFEIAFKTNNDEDVIRTLMRSSEELYRYNLDKYKRDVLGYSKNFNATKEVQIKGPIHPDEIIHIHPAEEAFMKSSYSKIKLAA
jgi:RHS repeat-associated protein